MTKRSAPTSSGLSTRSATPVRTPGPTTTSYDRSNVDANARTYVDQAAHVLRTDEQLAQQRKLPLADHALARTAHQSS